MTFSLRESVIDLLLIASINHRLDRSRVRMQITHRRREALVPHHFLDESRVSGLRHGHRAKRVPGTVQLQCIRNSELAGNFPEAILESTEFNVARLRTLRGENPAFGLSRLLLLNRSEKSNHAFAQRYDPPSFARLAVGVEVPSQSPLYTCWVDEKVHSQYQRELRACQR